MLNVEPNVECLINYKAAAVCRPAATSIIADLFSPDSRGVANGVFSWGIYFGYGLAFLVGNNVNHDVKIGIICFSLKMSFLSAPFMRNSILG